MTAELFREETHGIFHDVSSAEVTYEDNAELVDDGIQIEPFNLEQEREEGYFDAQGNFVEYFRENEIKDAWLDSAEIDTRFAEKNLETAKNEEDIHDLSSKDIGAIKRRIANLLEPGETVLQALRRLKGTTNSKKQKMPQEIKLMFDQLTEDSVKLMEDGDYNVYHETREMFEREAEGYERLSRAREGTSVSSDVGGSGSDAVKDIFSNGQEPGVPSSLPSDMVVGPSLLNSSTAQVSSSNGADSFDMFAEDDVNTTSNPSSDVNSLDSGSTPKQFPQPSSERVNTDQESGDLQSDYVYDESSGYYYSSSLGYYYDPTSGLYCCATSGKWYAFNEQTGAYDEIQDEATSEPQ
ncbi:PREDICTED: LIN1-like protein isoform X2 [Nelumbo nucifera]|nr:PREDICTED: LIN1-like protein isoform X2 [Nelumbo nucifera]